MSCSTTHYKLGYIRRDTLDTVVWLASVSMRTMTVDPPNGMAFTGMMLSLYAFGELEPCLDPADFEYAEWTEYSETG